VVVAEQPDGERHDRVIVGKLPVVGWAGACEALMAEPAPTSPPAAGVADRDALLATKLHVPRPIPASWFAFFASPAKRG